MYQINGAEEINVLARTAESIEQKQRFSAKTRITEVKAESYCKLPLAVGIAIAIQCSPITVQIIATLYADCCSLISYYQRQSQHQRSTPTCSGLGLKRHYAMISPKVAISFFTSPIDIILLYLTNTFDLYSLYHAM